MPTRPSSGWMAAAGVLAERVPRRALHPAVLAWADGRPGSERWAVALSGGSDSVALLLLLWAHWPARRDRLLALHFNHRLRGAESAADARFCARLCCVLGIKIVTDSWIHDGRGRSSADARAARFAFFERAMSRRRILSLWLGHQRDDVAESLLMRLSRGSGSAGLAAPRPVHRFPSGRAHLRPLLSLGKAELAGILRTLRIAWREDASNAGGAHFRNRLRREVIPRWVKASGRDALAGAALSRELLEEDDRALEGWVDALDPVRRDGTLALGRLSKAPRAVVRRALHRWLLAQPKAGMLSKNGFDALLKSVEKATFARHSLGNEGFAVIRGRKLRFMPSD